MNEDLNRIHTRLDELFTAQGEHARKQGERLTAIETKLELAPKPPEQPCKYLLAHEEKHNTDAAKSENRFWNAMRFAMPVITGAVSAAITLIGLLASGISESVKEFFSK